VQSEEAVRRRVFEAFERLLSQEATSTFSTAEIAKQAGVSKRTLYEVAPTKHALIVGVMERARQAPLSVLDEPVSSAQQALQVLRRFLLQWTTAAYAPTSINMIRLAMDEWRKAPELGAYYSESGGVFTTRRLAHWLAERKAGGDLRIDDGDALADIFRAVLIKQHLFSVAFGHRAAPSEQEIRDRIDALLALLSLAPAAE
jgi:AcrR family transcriptional regulator